jgi:methylphosphotriester-DNA--protein-cysteine methyltransferase
MKRRWILLGADGQSYESGQPGMLGGHRRQRIYGRLDCPAALRSIARGGAHGPYVRQRVFFADEAAARAAGYRPCAVCLRQQYRAWKAGRKNPEEAARRDP